MRRCDVRPFVGMNLPIAAGPGARPVDTAVAAEKLGYDFISVNDHPEGESPCHEAWTLLTWAAAHTNRIGLATRVLAVPFRSPALLAKMAATLAHLAPGRVILGLGGGAGDAELQAFGIPVPGAGEKIDWLSEATHVIRGLWTTPSFTYAGRHYGTDAATVEPRPTSPIPIWFGTFGPRALRLTGELADGWIPSLGYVPDAELLRMRRTVLTAAETTGRDPSHVKCVLNVVLRTDQEPADSTVIYGNADRITERLQAFLDEGFQGFNFVLPGRSPLDDAALVAEQVVPHLDAGT